MSEPEFDLVLRRGTVVDGSGGARFEADVAVRGGRIAEVGSVRGRGREEIDARDRLVTPGFVDIHTHYDGQITWEETLRPSSDHGVTTVVMGNCGVGFAPCRPADRDSLISVMEGVEDIPEIVMTAGLPWSWETYPDYLRFLDGRRSDIDFASYLPHSALRVFVMGKRGADLEPPTADDLARMTTLTEEGVRAGALGVSTSRSLAHKRNDGVLCPSVPSEQAELEALAAGLGATGKGIFQLIPNNERTPDEEFAVMRRLSQVSGRPISFSLLDWPHKPGDFEAYLALMDGARADGVPITAQVFPRPAGGLYGLDLSFHPFVNTPSFQALRALPSAQKAAAMRDPELRRRMVAESPHHSGHYVASSIDKLHGIYEMTDPVVYDPRPEDSIAARAQRLGISALELVYDLMVESDGKAIFYYPAANFVGGTLDKARTMMTHPSSVFGLGDGGAHYGLVSDASHPTFTLAYWTRDAAPERRVSIEWAVAALARKTALTVGLDDRGLIAPGLKADLNVIDMDRLSLGRPQPVYDLPAGGRRLHQAVTGYEAMVVSGEVTYRQGAHTGALPGRLVRSR